MDLSSIFDHPFVSSFLKFFGGIYLFFKFFPFISTFLDCYVNPGKNIKAFGAGSGAWAIITGCTEGIGKEFALQLAKADYNLVLISRNQEKLDGLKAEIEKDNEVSIKTLAIDFSEQGMEKYEKVKDLIKDLPIHILINNVGLSHEYPKYLEEEDDKRIEDILEINVKSTVFMTKTVIPIMKNVTKSSNFLGLIMTVGSFSGLIPTPLLTTYSSSKAFLQTFAASLAPELEKDKILVTNIIPYFVVSKMSKLRKATFMAPTPKAYVKATLSKIGVAGGCSIPSNSTPYFSHALINAVTDQFANRQFWVTMNMDGMVKTRSRALKKQARLAAEASEAQESSSKTD